MLVLFNSEKMRETIGTTTDSLKKMNFVQLEWIMCKSIFLVPGKFKTLTDLYLAVLYPTASGHGSERDYVVLHGAAYRNNPLFLRKKVNGNGLIKPIREVNK